MKYIFNIISFFYLFSTLVIFETRAKTIADVNFPDQQEINGKKLQLNGVALRMATIFNVKVYAVGLYLEKKGTTEQEVLAPESGIKKLQMQFLRDLSKEKMSTAFKEGLERNHIAWNKDLDTLFQDLTDFKKGDELIFIIDGENLHFSIGKSTQGTIKNADLAKNWLKLWVGKVVSEKLKEGLLGKEN